MAILQVKSIDDQLYKLLGIRAAMDNRSISQEVIAILKAYLAMPSSQHRQVNDRFLALCGTWEDETSAEEIVQKLRSERQRNERGESCFC